MLKEIIKFNLSEKKYNGYVNTYTYEPNRIELSFGSNDVPQDTELLSGFILIDKYGSQYGDYSSFKYIYRTIITTESTAIILTKLSDDVYISPEPYVPPKPEEQTIEELKSLKISECSKFCAETINNGCDVTINGVIEHFDYATAEDQSNIKELFDTACGLENKNKLLIAEGKSPIDIELPYHSKGNSCKLYTSEQIISIYTTCATLKTEQTTYYNQLKAYIISLKSKAEVIEVYYGQNLTGTYLDTYNTLVKQANDMANALLS